MQTTNCRVLILKVAAPRVGNDVLRLAGKLEWLEVMRGLAACWVLLHHANQSVAVFIGPVRTVDLIGRNGYLGVDFFFLLSGFIIAYSSNRLIATGRGLAKYAQARLTRIYVPYLPVGIAVLVIYLLFPQISQTGRTPGILTSITLIPTASPTALAVAWTLVHEMIFYCIFSLYFLSRRALGIGLVLWTASICVAFLLAPPQDRGGFGYFLSPVNLCFLLGIGIYYMTRNGIYNIVGITFGLLGIGLVVLCAAQSDPNRVLSTAGFSGLIVWATSEQARTRYPGRFWLFLGAASYSIYLVHLPVESLSVRVIDRFASITPTFAFFIVSTLALAAGCVYHYFYERQMLKFVRRRLEKRTETVDSGLTERIGYDGNLRPTGRASLPADANAAQQSRIEQ